ncbi:MAG TPA: hypothetical protein DC000_11745 [Clostridiales bacterium]|nr:hypothetical protein [Clostridiales bacterium]
MAELISTTYSTALFDVCVEENKVDEFMNEVGFINETLKNNDEFFEILKTPRININEKKKIIDNVFGDKVNKEIINFIKILIDKRRIGYIIDIANEFERMACEYKGIVKAKAYSSISLSSEQIIKLEKKLSEQSGKTVEIENIIDNSLLGGIMIKFNDVVIDGTLKGKLKSLENNLNRIIV